MFLENVIGHRHLVSRLVQAVARGTLPPSLVFSGPPNVGKATTALALAPLLNCERTIKPTADPSDSWSACGKCLPCATIARAARAFHAGRERPAIDCLQWLAPDEKASIKVEPVRDVLRRAAFRPLDGRTRLTIIDEAHQLEVGAQQALLKALEEPPPATRFILVTSQPDALLPTIRSRCSHLRFGPVSATEIADALVQRHGWSLAEAEKTAALSDGRPGRALRPDDRERLVTREVAIDVLSQVAGSRGPAGRLEAAQVLVARMDKGKPKTATRQEISARLEAMAALLRDIGVLVVRGDGRRLANADLTAALERLAPAFSPDRLVRAFGAVNRAVLALDRNAGQKVVADWLVLNL